MRNWISHNGTLAAAAVIAEGVAAYNALPVAIDKLGMVSGFVLTALVAGAIVYTWSEFFAAKTFLGKAFAAVVIGGMLTLSVVSSHTSSNLQETKSSEAKRLADQKVIDDRYATAEADYREKIKTLDDTWQAQEKSRMASLTQLNAEIKATNKKKQAEIYQQLLDKQTFLAGATPMPAYPEKPVKESLPPEELKPLVSDLSFLQSLVFNLLTPVFLWLRSRLPLVKKTGGSVRGSVRGLDAPLYASVRFSGEQTPVQTSAETAEKSEPERAQFSDEFEARSVPCDTQYGITLGIIQQHFGESERQARTRRAAAVKAGFVVKQGVKYVYPAKQAVKRTRRTAKVVQLKRVK